MKLEFKKSKFIACLSMVVLCLSTVVSVRSPFHFSLSKLRSESRVESRITGQSHGDKEPIDNHQISFQYDVLYTNTYCSYFKNLYRAFSIICIVFEWMLPSQQQQQQLRRHLPCPYLEWPRYHRHSP